MGGSMFAKKSRHDSALSPKWSAICSAGIPSGGTMRRPEYRFADRREAGRVLAERLTDYRDREDVIVLALPRGGVPVAYEVAEALHAPIDVFIVRKLGVPGHEELAMGAIASGGVRVMNEQIVYQLWFG